MPFGINFRDVASGAAHFVGGFSNAYASDNLLGVGRQDQHNIPGQVGAAFGDAAATVQGLFEMGGGAGGEVGGVVLDATGVGAIVGVPVNVASAAVIAHGATTSVAGFSHLLMAASGHGPSVDPAPEPPRAAGEPAAKPDVSNQFKFGEYQTPYGSTVKEASGELGVPGEVQTHEKAGSFSEGDDAGHLIGERFGAPGGSENLSPQNWRQNRFGTYKKLENQWASDLKNGSKVDVNVKDFTKAGETRPWKREVSWTETAPNGAKTDGNLTFLNTHTAESRAGQGIPATVPPGHPGGTVIPLHR
jgi:hypothetical protein